MRLRHTHCPLVVNDNEKLSAEDISPHESLYDCTGFENMSRRFVYHT